MTFSARLLLIATSFFCLCSCVSSVKSTIDDDGKQIPPDFGNTNEILLVIRKGKRSYDKYLEENFEKNYFGKYIIIDRVELESDKYKNLEVYRYVFDEDYHQVYTTGNGQQVDFNGDSKVKGQAQRNDPGLQMYAKFQVLDRRSGTIYRTKHGTAAFSKWMRAYIQALEKSRQDKTKK